MHIVLTINGDMEQIVKDLIQDWDWHKTPIDRSEVVAGIQVVYRRLLAERRRLTGEAVNGKKVMQDLLRIELAMTKLSEALVYIRGGEGAPPVEDVDLYCEDEEDLDGLETFDMGNKYDICVMDKPEDCCDDVTY